MLISLNDSPHAFSLVQLGPFIFHLRLLKVIYISIWILQVSEVWSNGRRPLSCLECPVPCSWASVLYEKSHGVSTLLLYQIEILIQSYNTLFPENTHPILFCGSQPAPNPPTPTQPRLNQYSITQLRLRTVYYIYNGLHGDYSSTYNRQFNVSICILHRYRKRKHEVVQFYFLEIKRCMNVGRAFYYGCDDGNLIPKSIGRLILQYVYEVINN